MTEKWFGPPVKMDHLKGRLRRSVRFEISNVTDHVVMMQQEAIRKKKSKDGALTEDDLDFLCCAPPFDNMWFEYKFAKNQRPTVDLVTADDDPRPTRHRKPGQESMTTQGLRYGVGITVWPLECPPGQDVSDDAHREIVTKQATELGIPIDENSKWIFLCEDFMQVSGQGANAKRSRTSVVGPNHRMVYVIDKSGDVYWHRFTYFNEKWSEKDTLNENEYSIQRGYMLPILFALTFLNCRNVVHEECAPSKRFSRAHERRTGAPLTTYKVIKINLNESQVIRDRPDGEHQGGTMPLHICRGHFRQYTEDKPLFGNYVGPVWIPMHARGRASAGEIVKDYELETSE
jgi:hypothetical protein